MAREIERKYLPASEAWRGLARGERICQGYLCSGPSGAVRVRLAGDQAWIGVKGPTRGLTRNEFEYPIPLEDAKAMLAELGPLIEKTRHKIPHAGKIWEVDEFHGLNQGLVLIEVELEHEGESPQKPAWVGREVTDDPRFYNAALATCPYSMWPAPHAQG